MLHIDINQLDSECFTKTAVRKPGIPQPAKVIFQMECNAIQNRRNPSSRELSSLSQVTVQS